MAIHIVRLYTLRFVTAICASAVAASLAGCGGIPPTGISQRGAIFAPATSQETTLHSFDFTDGAYNSYSGLVFDAAGNLYGTTIYGGTSTCNLAETCGVLFELSPVGNGQWTEKVLHNFSQNDPLGWSPRSGLIVDAAGDLYGTTDDGGPFCSSCYGTVFELLPNNGQWTTKVLHAFQVAADGVSPQAPLAFDATGNLYGTTAEGGANFDYDGVIFELRAQPGGSYTYTVLHSFTNSEGSSPGSKLTFDKAGNLYGTTRFGGAYPSGCGGYGCGTAFQLKPHSNGHWTLKVLHSFGKALDGAFPVSALTVDDAGSLYGVTAQGGKQEKTGPRQCFAYGCGTAFRLTRGKADTWSEQIIHYFGSGNDGNLPEGDLIFDNSGALYGTTVEGGPYGHGYGGGTAFRLTPAGSNWTETILHSFGSGTDGVNPFTGMIFDKAHNLYGTTETGGDYRRSNCQKSHGCGTVFEITSSR